MASEHKINISQKYINNAIKSKIATEPKESTKTKDVTKESNDLEKRNEKIEQESLKTIRDIKWFSFLIVTFLITTPVFMIPILANSFNGNKTILIVYGSVDSIAIATSLTTLLSKLSSYTVRLHSNNTSNNKHNHKSVCNHSDN